MFQYVCDGSGTSLILPLVGMVSDMGRVMGRGLQRVSRRRAKELMRIGVLCCCPGCNAIEERARQGGFAGVKIRVAIPI